VEIELLAIAILNLTIFSLSHTLDLIKDSLKNFEKF